MATIVGLRLMQLVNDITYTAFPVAGLHFSEEYEGCIRQFA